MTGGVVVRMSRLIELHVVYLAVKLCKSRRKVGCAPSPGAHHWWFVMKRLLLLLLLAALMHVTLSQTRMFYFVPNNMSWSKSQTYCRQHHIDLATVYDRTDLDEMMRVIKQVHIGVVWTGLGRTDATASWIWSDQSPTTFIPWSPGQPNNWNNYQYCVAVTQDAGFNDLNCEIAYPAVCYTERRKQTVRLELKSSQNVSDPAVKTEILQKIGEKLKEKGLTDYAKLSWKIQPDGNIFQKSQRSKATQP
ncbi:C-type lectin lectoxin-Lio3 isoform X1 [Labeo rohita]|uniref:C-type lectin lectoxin-Lio3 isoform X1 n=1 Tax=Labeo rohita TaxID=84645 RepID=UPI0021E2A5FA|nr:C-type lectin lectoxin-Lio3 isoform X1 [Labeo rohita]